MRLSAWRVIFGLSVIFLATGPASAQDVWKPDTQIGDFQFNMPDGWKRVASPGGGFVLVPKNLPKGGTAAIDFIATQDLQGDFRAWFNARWAEWQKQFKVQQAGEITLEHNPKGFDTLRIDARVSNQQLGYTEFVYAAVKSGNRVGGYYWISNTGYYSYRESLTDFEHSLLFGKGKLSGGEQTAANAGGMQGLYVGYKMRGLAGLKTHFEYLVFFPDGNLIRFLPEPGLDNFDFRNALKTSRDYCGRYRVNGNQIKITWADNSTENAVRNGTALKIQGDSYFPVPKFDGQTLNGTYHQEGAGGAPYSIRFTAAGQFTDSGILNLLLDPGKKHAPGQGTYRIGNNTITLSYADGRRVPLSFFIFGNKAGEPAANRIHINTYPLVLK